VILWPSVARVRVRRLWKLEAAVNRRTVENHLQIEQAHIALHNATCTQPLDTMQRPRLSADQVGRVLDIAIVVWRRIARSCKIREDCWGYPVELSNDDSNAVSTWP
jgi:hypothetical protein